MFRYITIALALLIGASASGQSLPGYGGGLSGGTIRVHPVSFTSSQAAGVYSFGLAFPLATMDFERGSAFVGVLYACDTNAPDTDGDADLSDEAACEQLATLSADTANSSMKAKKLYYAVDINTAETGTNVSRLTIKGTFDQVASSGAPAAFSSGSTFTEQDYVGIQSLTQITTSDDDLFRIYVSNADEGDLPIGNDANPGTALFPLLTLDKARQVAHQAGRAWILLDSEDTWANADVCTGANEPYTFCTGADAGTGSLALDAAFDGMDPNATPNEIGIRISSTDPTGVKKATIACNVEEAGAGTTNIFNASPSSGDEGWIVVENIRTTDCNSWDHYNTVLSGGKLLVIGAECTASRGTQDASGHCVVGKGLSSIVTVNSSFRTVAGSEGSNEANDALALIEISGGTASPLFVDFFSTWDMADADYGTTSRGNTMRVYDDSKAMFIGTTISSSGENNTEGPVRQWEIVSSNATDDLEVTLIRAVSGNMDADNDTDDLSITFWMDNNTSGSRIELRTIQSTISNAPVGVFTSNVNHGSSPILWYARGFLWDELVNRESLGSNYILYANGTMGDLDVDISKSVYDEDESRVDTDSEWHVAGGSREKCADGRDAATWTNWWDSCDTTYESGGVGTDGDQFGGLVDQGVCANDQICNTVGYTDVYAYDFPVAIPAFLMGSEKSALRLNGPGGNIGAR